MRLPLRCVSLDPKTLDQWLRAMARASRVVLALAVRASRVLCRRVELCPQILAQLVWPKESRHRCRFHQAFLWFLRDSMPGWAEHVDPNSGNVWLGLSAAI